MDKLRDKCQGSLIGGAVGDALGYEVEFMSLASIRKHFGKDGIHNYVLNSQSVANFSDDTQMTLFTAEGLLNAINANIYKGKDIVPYISKAYGHWYFTQAYPQLAMSSSWLTHIKALWTRRAPGNTCLSAMECIVSPQARPVVNNSKGCGGVMRVAPIGIYATTHPTIMNLTEAGTLAGYAAEITHKHPASTFSSMALAMIVADCICNESVDRDKFKFIVLDRVFKLIGLTYNGDTEFEFVKNLVIKALDLAQSDISDTDAIRQLGEGWIAEETLAIAIFSVMRYIDDFEKCIVCAVNHDGDSDSTGAVAGNIIGAILGYSAIPPKYLDHLELHDLIVSVADDLSGFSPAEQMNERYTKHTPFGIAKELLITNLPNR